MSVGCCQQQREELRFHIARAPVLAARVYVSPAISVTNKRTKVPYAQESIFRMVRLVWLTWSSGSSERQRQATTLPSLSASSSLSLPDQMKRQLLALFQTRCGLSQKGSRRKIRTPYLPFSNQHKPCFESFGCAASSSRLTFDGMSWMPSACPLAPSAVSD